MLEVYIFVLRDIILKKEDVEVKMRRGFLFIIIFTLLFTNFPLVSSISNNDKSTFNKIVVDGLEDDWRTIPPLIYDIEDDLSDSNGNISGVDIQSFSFYRSGGKLYGLFKVYGLPSKSKSIKWIFFLNSREIVWLLCL